jgi:hypothetical protein
VDVLIEETFGLLHDGNFQIVNIVPFLCNDFKCRVLIMAVDYELDPNELVLLVRHVRHVGNRFAWVLVVDLIVHRPTYETVQYTKYNVFMFYVNNSEPTVHLKKTETETQRELENKNGLEWCAMRERERKKQIVGHRVIDMSRYNDDDSFIHSFIRS